MNLTKVSKFISLVLRHKPEEAGITLDKHGWADTELLVDRLAARYPGFTFAMLEEIVRTDDKQRYSFTDDRTQIRANQGHSIPVDLGLEPVEPPKYLYHGTATKYLSDIFRDGLIPKSRQYVHLSEDVETAINVGKRHGEPVVFYIFSGDMHDAGFTFHKSENGVWLTERVPIEYLFGYELPRDEGGVKYGIDFCKEAITKERR